MIVYGRPDWGDSMKTVRHILSAKGSDVYEVAPEASVYEALRIMAAKNVGALVVLEAGTLVGIISERDYARRVILEDRSSLDTPVSHIMTSDVKTVDSTFPIESCMELMTESHIRHLPVLEDGELLGVISIGDVVREVIADLAAMVEQLDGYIRGR